MSQPPTPDQEAQLRNVHAGHTERELARLLPLWPPNIGPPVEVYDRFGYLRGLGPQVPVGCLQPIVLPARTLIVALA